MTDKEMLANLLHFAEQDCICTDCYVCDYFQTKFCKPTKMADYLLSNGVTFQKWIPVTERLPEHGQEVIVYSGNVLKPTVFAYQFWNPKYDSWKHITHWMPLPEPPKEDV